MAFQLSEAVNRDKVFLVKRSGLEGRLDPHYYEPRFIENERKLQKIGCRKLGNLSAIIFSGITPTSGGDAYCEIGQGIPFVRSGDFSEDGEINFDDLLYIKPEIHNGIMRGSLIKQHDILIAIVGATIGKVGIYKETRESNINQAIAAVRLKSEVLPEFVRTFLLTYTGQMVIERIKRPVARANINLAEVSSFSIPIIEISTQKKIVAKINSAYTAKKEKAAQAQQLLDSINTYLLNELGIQLPVEDENTIRQRMFFRKFSKISGGRFDPISSQLKVANVKEAIANGIYPYDKLKHIVISKGEQVTEIEGRTYIGLENIQSNFGEYVPADEKTSISSALTFSHGNILFPKLRPYLNKVFLGGTPTFMQ